MEVLNGLQLTPFEWTMTKACASSPMEFAVRLVGSGTVNTEKFTNAVLSALKHQPLLQANLILGHTHRLSQWRPATNPNPQIIWQAENPSSTENPDFGSGYPDDFESIDLSTEIGFRLYGWQYRFENEDQIELSFVFHHACCDGKGAISFIEHVLRNYDSVRSGEPLASKPPIQIELVTNRDARAAEKLSLAKRMWRSFALRPKRAWNTLSKKPATVSVRQSSPDVHESSLKEAYAQPPAQCSLALDVQSTQRLGGFATEHQTTVNSVLVAKLFLTLNEFLQRSCSDPLNLKRCIRVMIPFSLRDHRHDNMPAANCVSMAYIEASQNQMLAGDLLNHITRQIQFIWQWQFQYAWLEFVESYTRLWPVIKLFKGNYEAGSVDQPEKPIATSVLSNLGGVFKDSKFKTESGRIKIGDLLIKRVHLALPCTAAMPINFSVNFYSGRLSLDVTYLPSIISQTDAAELLAQWRKNITEAM